jgi:hypothetical protein
MAYKIIDGVPYDKELLDLVEQQTTGKGKL